MAATNPQQGDSVVALLRDIITELQNVVAVLERIARSIGGGGQQ